MHRPVYGEASPGILRLTAGFYFQSKWNCTIESTDVSYLDVGKDGKKLIGLAQ